MAPPEHSVILDLCAEKFRAIEKHLEDAPKHRDKIVRHELRIGTVEGNLEKIAIAVDKFRGVKMSVILSAMAIIVTIALAGYGLAVQWGKVLAKVEQFDKIYTTITAKDESFQRRVY